MASSQEDGREDDAVIIFADNDLPFCRALLSLRLYSVWRSGFVSKQISFHNKIITSQNSKYA